MAAERRRGGPSQPRGSRPRNPRDGGQEQVLGSTTLRRVSYLRERRMLRLTFATGKIYEYFEVPPQIHAALMAAGSKGGYFNRYIRPRFAYRRVR